MDGSLVFQLVHTVAIRPRYERRRRKLADETHRIVCALGLGLTRQPHLSGLMDVLSFLSESILRQHGFATRWYLPPCDGARYYPLHIQALDLHPHQYAILHHTPNPLGGYSAP